MHDWDTAVRMRAISFTLKKWGSLRDLPSELASVVWVTALESADISMRVEAAGGSWGMVSADLRGERMTLMLREASTKVKFLDRVLPEIRNADSKNDRLSNASSLLTFSNGTS